MHWLLILLFSLAGARASTSEPLGRITTYDLLRHIRVLASDEFDGRAPGTPGEDRTIDYLMKQFKASLRPGNPDGTYVQNVPLVGITGQSSALLSAGGKPLEVFIPRDCVIWSKRLVPEIKVENTDIVFVGYGVVAPEYQWDDFKDVDVRGKTILMLVNDPPIPDPNDSSKLEEKMFKGRSMTYYGRWTYKYEIATRKGASAAIIVHETGPAGYPWAVVVGSNTRENMDLKSPGGNMDRVAIEGWITSDTATKLCSAAGEDFQALRQRAIRRDFRPVPLSAKATFTVTNKWREISSRNVVGKLDGSDSKLKDEVIVYTRTGIISGAIQISKGTRFTTARWITRLGRQRCSNWRRLSRKRVRNVPWFSFPSRPKKRVCSARAITLRTLSTLWSVRSPTSTSMALTPGAARAISV